MLHADADGLSTRSYGNVAMLSFAPKMAAMDMDAVGVIMRRDVVVAAYPLDQHTQGEQQDENTDCLLSPLLKPKGQGALEKDKGQTDGEKHRGVAYSPPGAEPHRAPGLAVINRDQRGDCHQMVGVRRTPQTEDERDAQSYEEGRTVKKTGQPSVQLFCRVKEEVEGQVPSTSRNSAVCMRRLIVLSCIHSARINADPGNPLG